MLHMVWVPHYFLIGYLIFEIPSNMYLKKVGARATLTRIMLLWGVLTMLMSTVDNTTSFYVFRFLLVWRKQDLYLV